MPYKPYAPTEVSRSYAYKHAWFSAASSVACLPLYLSGVDGIVYALVFGTAVGGVVASAISGHPDDYYRSLCAVGHRWVMCALGAYLLGGWIFWTLDIGFPPGLGLLAGTPAPAPSLFFDGHLFALGLAVIYHAGYVFQWLRDHVGQTGE